MEAFPDLLVAENQADPFPVYERLRAEDPVHWNPRLRAWIVTRFDDVHSVLSQPGVFSVDRFRRVGAEFLRRRPDMRDVAVMMRDWAVYRDPPDHTRLRALLGKSFSPQRIASLEPMIQELVDDLLDGLERREIDYVSEFAFPLPAQVICRLLGVPTEDLLEIREWSKQIAAYIGGAHRGDDIERAKQGLCRTFEYFRALVRDRSRWSSEECILEILLTAEEQGDVLSEDEVVANCVLLLFAGHETTANLLGSGLLRLLLEPEQLERLRASPELAPSAVEEFLRLDPPVAGTLRVVTEDTEVREQRLERGQIVAAMIAAANRDPEVFDAPESLDLARSPNRHLTFGYGIHFCLGAPLARMEARIAFTTLLQRFGRIERIGAEARWTPQLFFRGPESLPLRMSP